MKKYSHAWLAFMAIKRLEVIATTTDTAVVKGVADDVRLHAKSLWKWFKDYRDFVIEGAWYPDDVFKDMSTSHIVKYQPAADGNYSSFRGMPNTHSISAMMKKSSPLYQQPYNIVKGNCADRCESIAHSIVDNFKMLQKEERGCPITTTNNHIALRFFILSHYVADCHMPFHCDNRPFSDEKGLHGSIEKKWEDQIKKSYKIDTDNNRFYYDPDGYPLPLKVTQLLQDVENEVNTRPYVHGWGTNNSSTWDYMSGVSQYSYLFSYYLVPESFTPSQSYTEFTNLTEWGRNFDTYNKMIFADAIDSIARIWLHVWIKYKNWLKE
ncbi:MAG: hypothetical protein K6G31_04615 [Paludibacteraceae bacterium]|nr:hypothetical protein [Paludibacteraceae bacterium]